MQTLTSKELMEIRGGAISGAIWNAINKSIEFVIELGRNLGSSIRRLVDKKLCNY